MQRTWVLLACLLSVVAAETVIRPFKIVPWKDDEATIDLAGKQCKFSWRGHGGSEDEEWTLEFSLKASEYTCEIRRLAHGAHGHTHFVGFKASLEGVAELITADAWDHQGALLRDADFVVRGNSVSNVPSWGKELDKVVLSGK
mmetsp:Transcript_26873/g.61928  ORF Transcript_26873/g.61928 Transcript_26873/m.61928 type:complete len:143 (-) Transcript_26873:79-507(-)